MENEEEKPKRSIASYVVLAILLLFILVCLVVLLGPAIGNVIGARRAVDHYNRGVDYQQQGQLD